MKIRILKGTNEIGGSCVEVSTENTTILLDYGTALEKESVNVVLDRDVDAVLISHPHQDHYGEIVQIASHTPVYCGEISLGLMNATQLFTGKPLLENKTCTFKAWEDFSIGDFTITSYLVDHSATDAYAFLIKADGKSLFYSGDFRSNGRKAKLFNNACKNKDIKDVDVLIMEGTMLNRSNLDFEDETSVENKIIEVFSSNNDLSFLVGSSQNIDRIVSAYMACKSTNKYFVVDIYTAWILDVVSKRPGSKVPNISWENVKVITEFGGGYYEVIKANRNYFNKFIHNVFRDTVSLDDLQNSPSKYCLKISSYHIEKLLHRLELKQANIIYSQWLGYRKEEFSPQKTVELYNRLEKTYNLVYAHTGGHADLESLKAFAKALNPKKIIPIHTQYKECFGEYFPNVLVLDDNESYEVQ